MSVRSTRPRRGLQSDTLPARRAGIPGPAQLHPGRDDARLHRARVGRASSLVWRSRARPHDLQRGLQNARDRVCEPRNASGRHYERARRHHSSTIPSFHYSIIPSFRVRPAGDLHGRGGRNPVQWRPVARGGPGAGLRKKPSEPDQDRWSIDLSGLSGCYACVGKRWIVWSRPTNRFPQERFFFIGTRSCKP